MNERETIRYWNRKTQCEEAELVFGEEFMRWAYETPIGLALEGSFLSRRWISAVYGAYQNSPLSARKIPEFIRKFHIKMEEFEGQSYRSFNEFFIRRFKPGARKFESQPSVMPAFAEGRYFAFDQINDVLTFPVKGSDLTAARVLGSSDRAKPFLGGPVIIARLCPTDYHRFHFPDDGVVEESFRVPGALHSVNPLALKSRSAVFAENERQVTMLKTRNFGLIAYVEVGALCVGRIVQSHLEREFKRGEEKGYFLFGGSTVIIFGEAGKWSPDAELLKETRKKRETFIELGDRVAQR